MTASGNRSRTSSRRRTGRLVVLSGPSGCGKTTIGERLSRRRGLRRVVTATSRTPRTGEKDGRDYRFHPPAEFRALARRGEFLEHVRTLGHYYGTPRAAVEEILEDGDFALLIIDVKGAAKVRKAGARGIFIFIAPPSLDELRRRLEKRGTENAASVRSRLRLARRELERKDDYDHIVVNDTVARAVREILGILRRHGWSGKK